MKNYLNIVQISTVSLACFILKTFVLQEQIRSAESRVVLDSLYFGTGNSTDDLVRITNQQLHKKSYNSCLRLKLLIQRQ